MVNGMKDIAQKIRSVAYYAETFRAKTSTATGVTDPSSPASPLTGASAGYCWITRGGNSMPVQALTNGKVWGRMVGSHVICGVTFDEFGGGVEVIRVDYLANVQEYGVLVADRMARGAALSPDLEELKHNYTATTDPTVDDDNTRGYSVNSLWVNQTADIAYICVDASTGAADWMPIADAADVAQVASDLSDHETSTAEHGATGAVVGTTNTQTLTNKTLTTPTIADFTNAQHDHLDAEGGGTLTSSAIQGNSGGTVNTTDDTPTTVQTIATATDVSYVVDVTIVARRTGGTAGSAGDSAAYWLRGLFVNVAGTLTQVGATEKVEFEDQAGWDADFAVSGTDILVQFTGAVDNDVTIKSNATVRSV